MDINKMVASVGKETIFTVGVVVIFGYSSNLNAKPVGESVKEIH